MCLMRQPMECAIWGSLWNVLHGAAYGMCFMGQPMECALWDSLWNVLYGAAYGMLVPMCVSNPNCNTYMTYSFPSLSEQTMSGGLFILDGIIWLTK
jgi:hypothetical protein